MWPFRSKPKPSKLVGETVGLDHVAVRGVAPAEPAAKRLIFTHGNVEYHVESFQVWREYMRDQYKLGRSRHRVIEVARPREAFFQFQTENDYNTVRRMMFDSGMYVSPFDTITPEGIING